MSAFDALRARMNEYREMAEAALAVAAAAEHILSMSNRAVAIDMASSILGAAPSVGEIHSWAWYSLTTKAKAELTAAEESATPAAPEVF